MDVVYNKVMNKKVILFFAMLVSFIGSYIPVWLGGSFFGGWSILGSMIGGFVGIWLGVVLSKRFG